MVYDGITNQLSASTRKGSRLIFDKMSLVQLHDETMRDSLEGTSWGSKR